MYEFQGTLFNHVFTRGQATIKDFILPSDITWYAVETHSTYRNETLDSAAESLTSHQNEIKAAIKKLVKYDEGTKTEWKPVIDSGAPISMKVGYELNFAVATIKEQDFRKDWKNAVNITVKYRQRD